MHETMAKLQTIEENLKEAVKHIKKAVMLDPTNHMLKGELTRLTFILNADENGENK